MNHRPVYGYQGEHQAPVVVHSVRRDWAALRPHRPTLQRLRACWRLLQDWNLTDGIRLN